MITIMLFAIVMADNPPFPTAGKTGNNDAQTCCSSPRVSKSPITTVQESDDGTPCCCSPIDFERYADEFKQLVNKIIDSEKAIKVRSEMRTCVTKLRNCFDAVVSKARRCRS